MSSYTASDADRLRIAIALTALKFKPADQSCAAYVVQLRSFFPPSEPDAPTSDGSWKGHALALEKDLADLKAKYDAEQIKVISAASKNASDSPASGSQPPKRKIKKKSIDKTLDAPARADLETVLEDLEGLSDFAALPTSDSLFSSVSAFQQLTSALASSSNATTAAQRSLLSSTTIRALNALANILQPILCSSNLTVPSQAATLQTLALLVHHLVTSSVPYLLRKPKKNAAQPAPVSSLLNKVLDTLITRIFHPILESFTPLSQRYLKCLLAPRSPKVLPTDLRRDVLHLFQSAFAPLVSAPSSYDVNLRGTIALVALRELENVFPPPGTVSVRHDWTHDNRVRALVRKDAFWYQCTALHVVFAPSAGGATARADGAVSEPGIVDALSRILRRCRGSSSGSGDGATAACNAEAEARDGDSDVDVSDQIETPHGLDSEAIDEVSYGMILGVMERYWRWTGDVQGSI